MAPRTNSEEERRGSEQDRRERDPMEKLADDVEELADAMHGRGKPEKIKNSVFQRLSNQDEEIRNLKAELARVKEVQDRGLKIILGAAGAAVAAAVATLWGIIVRFGK
jgi:hypothetical protein